MNHLSRRSWIAASALLAASTAFGNGQRTGAYRYLVANPVRGTAILPDECYIPFDWAVSEIPAGDGLTIDWKPVTTRRNSKLTLRITSATDVREAIAVTVKTASSGRVLGVFDIQYAMYLQPFELPIATADGATIMQEGLTLTMTKGSKPFWIFVANNARKSAPAAYLPHLLQCEGEPNQAAGLPDHWKSRLLSLDSVQTFGWMEGCVLDGLSERSASSPGAKAVLQQHLALFFANDSLVYANLNNRKATGEINSVESILPFAILAQTNPAHPLLQTAIDFCQHHANAGGVVADGTSATGVPANRMIKTEECYTVSYPLAVLANTLNRPDLADLAVKTLLARVKLLDHGMHIFQRGTEQGELAFDNWSRGVVWYLLGLVKTLAHLPNDADTQTLKQALQAAVTNVLTYQQPNGLWFCYMHQAETGYETSGTAGIAAALTYGVQKNLLPKIVLSAVAKAKKGLTPYLTPDGYLTGTAQGNKGGDGLQRNGFRVISPYTLGFLAHLDT